MNTESSVDNEELQGGFMLCFLDDGCGMSPEEASDIIYFGTSKKRLSTLKFIGQYGNGLKSGSMRIGKDFILFTKKEETMTCVFFSQTFCEREGLSEVVVPIPSWLTRTRESVTDDPQKFSTELSIIYKYSPFKTEAELMQQFNVIYGKCGTLLVVYNLKLLLSGEPELDVKTDREDILMAGALGDFPERWSFRAYTSVLYFDPWMRIFIQAKRVRTKYLCYCLYRPRKYLYVTSSFKGAFKCEVKKAEEAVKRAELILKEAQIKVNHSDRTPLSSSAKDVLQKALEDVKAKQKVLQEKQRELKKARTLTLFFGVNIENRSQAGMFIYSSNRLIKMHEKVGPQLKLKSLLGEGVVGIVNIPLEIMEPSHNKQEFLNVHEYNHLLKVMGQYLVQYCKDTGIKYIMRNAGLEQAQAGIKIARRNINNLRYADDTTLMAESEELKSLLMKVKEESEKVGLKLNIQKTKIMASSPITSWQIDGETVETVADFISGDSEITADGDCSQEIKRCLLLGSKVMTNLDSILKSRDITLPTKIHLVKAMVFPVVMYGCESWTIKKAER